MIIPLIVFFVLPIQNMGYKLSWQYGLVLLVGALLLVEPFINIWIKLFIVIVLLQLFLLRSIKFSIRLPQKTIEILTKSLFDRSLIVILMIFIGCFLITRYQKLKKEHCLNVICISALLLCSYIVLQIFGYFTLKTAGGLTCLGRFNSTSAGIYLALCFPAFLRKRWCFCLLFLAFGLYRANSTTAYICVFLSLLYFLYSIKEITYLHLIAFSTCIIVGFFLYNNGYIVKFQAEIQNNIRWSVWDVGFQACKDQLWGRGLGSWKILFPYCTEKRILWWSNAHNEYLQGFFEYGIQFIVFIICFIGCFIYHFFNNQIDDCVASGMVAIFVSCFAFPVMHIGPLALLCFVWFGIYFQQLERMTLENKLMKSLTARAKK